MDYYIDTKDGRRLMTEAEVTTHLASLDEPQTTEELGAEKIAAVTTRLQEFINQTAWDNGNYGHNGVGDIENCAKYALYDNPWRAECLALIKWSGACWVKALAILAEYESGGRPEPTAEEVIAELPPFGGE